MRKSFTLALALGSVVGCSSTDPSVPTPAPTAPEPEPAISDVEPQVKKQPAPSKAVAQSSRVWAHNLAPRDPVPLARAHANEPYPVPNVTACGSNTCLIGEFCCNASCGICAPVNGSCSQQVCGPNGE